MTSHLLQMQPGLQRFLSFMWWLYIKVFPGPLFQEDAPTLPGFILQPSEKYFILGAYSRVWPPLQQGWGYCLLQTLVPWGQGHLWIGESTVLPELLYPRHSGRCEGTYIELKWMVWWVCLHRRRHMDVISRKSIAFCLSRLLGMIAQTVHCTANPGMLLTT